MLERYTNVWDIKESEDLLAKKKLLIIDGWHRITALKRIMKNYPDREVEWPKVSRFTL